MILSRAEIYSTDDDSLIVRDEAFYGHVLTELRDHRNLLDSLRACHAALEAWMAWMEAVNAALPMVLYQGEWIEKELRDRAIELTKAAGIEWPKLMRSKRVNGPEQADSRITELEAERDKALASTSGGD